MTIIYHCRGVYGDNAILDLCAPTIEKLCSGNYHGLNIEKLQGTNKTVFSARINDTHRVLFIIIMVKGVPCIHLVEIVPDHDYQKARFLKDNVLKRYLNLYGEDIAQQIERDFFTPINAEYDIGLPNSRDNSPLYYKAVDYYNGTTFILNDEQEQLLTATLPIVVSGAPGSGKSSTALSLISQYIDNYQMELSDVKILYTTPSKRLNDTMKNLWAELAEGNPDKIQAVEFKTCEQALWPKDSLMLNESDFISWWNNGPNSFQKQIQAIMPKLKASTIYQEFRIIPVYTEEKYRQLGKHQTHIESIGIRKILFSAYQRYHQYLLQLQHSDPQILSAEPNQRYDLIIVDETQNISLIQAKNLHQLAKNNQICFCVDTHQMNFSAHSLVRPYLLHTLTNNRHIQLRTTYRCPRHVTEIANKILELKYFITGGLSEKNEYSYIEIDSNITKNGQVIWINPDNISESTRCITQINQSIIAIIAHPKQHQEVKHLFPKALLFTPEEAGGLEFKNVLLFDLLNGNKIKNVNEPLSEIAEITCNSSPHRAKQIADMGTLDQQQVLNILYTCATRATDTLIIYQKTEHNNEHLVTALKNIIQQQTLSCSSSSLSSSAEPVIIQPVTTKELQVSYDYLVKHGFKNQAAQVQQRLHHLPARDMTTPKQMLLPIQQITDDELNGLISPLLKKINLPSVSKGKNKGKTKQTFFTPNPCEEFFNRKQVKSRLLAVLFTTTTQYPDGLFHTLMTAGDYYKSYLTKPEAIKALQDALKAQPFETWPCPAIPLLYRIAISSKKAVILKPFLNLLSLDQLLAEYPDSKHQLMPSILACWSKSHKDIALLHRWLTLYMESAQQDPAIIVNTCTKLLDALCLPYGNTILMANFISSTDGVALLSNIIRTILLSHQQDKLSVLFQSHNKTIIPLNFFMQQHDNLYTIFLMLWDNIQTNFPLALAFLETFFSKEPNKQPTVHALQFIKTTNGMHWIEISQNIAPLIQSSVDLLPGTASERIHTQLMILLSSVNELFIKSHTSSINTLFKQPLSEPKNSKKTIVAQQKKTKIPVSYFSVDYLGQNKLHKACFTNNLAHVKEFITYAEQANINIIDKKDTHDKSPLIYAIEGGYDEIIDYLIQHKANVNSTHNSHKTPLTTAVFSNGNLSIIQLLLEHGANPNHFINDIHETLLMISIKKNDIELVKLILTYGMNLIIDKTNKNGSTALLYAITGNHKDLIILLIQYGANIHSSPGSNISTPLMTAFNDNQFELTKYLLDCGADINQTAYDTHDTLLMLATMNGALEFMILCLDYSANINYANRLKATALHTAVFVTNIDSVRLLVERGANIMLLDIHNRTPLDIAKESYKRQPDTEMAQIISYLEDKQAELAYPQDNSFSLN